MERNYQVAWAIFAFLIFVPVVMTAQSVDIKYKEKGRNIYSATMYFSDENGGENPDPEAIRNDENIYFTLIPNINSEREYFKDNDLTEELMQIHLTQDGQNISRAMGLQPIPNGNGKVTRVMYIYPKRNVTMHKPFVFKSLMGVADTIILDDEFYPYYPKYEKIYRDGMQFSSQRHYIKTFQTLLPVINDAGSREEITCYSFYPHLSQTLMETAISQHADSLRKLFDDYSRQMICTPDDAHLALVDSVVGMMNEGYAMFTPYFEMGFPKSNQLHDSYLDAMNTLATKREDLLTRYQRNRLKFLQTNTYKTFHFSFFVDLLARMVTGLDTLRILDGYDTLSFRSLDRLKPYKEELVRMKWDDDFRIFIDLINEDILTHGRILGDSVMNNLEAQVAREKQPYFQIFQAFNTLNKDHFLFKTYLTDALNKCTDRAILKNLEMWILSCNITAEGLSAETVSDINKGIRLVRNERWGKAKDVFEIMTRLANTVAPPWYYAGEVLYKQGEPFAAEAKFDRALMLYPEYIAPRLYKFSIQYDNGNYDDLISGVNEALEINDIWLFHYWKARGLFAKEKYNESAAELKNACIGTNPWSFEQYMLLGDAYLKLGKYEEAKNAYDKGMEIDPYASAIYNEKMTNLQSARK